MLFHGYLSIFPPPLKPTTPQSTPISPKIPPSMAASSATTTPAFKFHLSTTKPRTHLHHLTFSSSSSLLLKPQSITSALHNHPKLNFISKSIDVSKEDKPTSEQQPPITESPPPPSPPPPEFSSPEFQSETDLFDQRRLEEKFAVLNTGIHECRSCGYLYNQATGDPSYPVPPGLPFDQLPEDWRCATCGAAKSFFQNKSVEIAGFAENQQYGLGGNTLTSGQKAILIYGSLLFFFVLFLSGYFLQ